MKYCCEGCRMEQEQKQVVSKEYSEHFLQLRAKGNWQMHMEGVTHLTSTLASPGVFARQNLLYLESIVLYHNTPAGFFVHRKNYSSYQIVYTFRNRLPCLRGQGVSDDSRRLLFDRLPQGTPLLHRGRGGLDSPRRSVQRAPDVCFF